MRSKSSARPLGAMDAVSQMTMKTVARTLLFTTVFLSLACGGSCKKSRTHETVIELDPVQIKYQEWLKRGSTALPEVEKLLREEDRGDFRTRTHALLALGKIGDRRSGPLVFEILKNDPHPAVKNCAVIALADLHYTEAVPYLISIAPPQTGPVDPGIILDNLGRMGDARAVPVLVGALKSDNFTLVLKAQNALIELKSASAVPLLLELAESGGRFDKEVAAVLGAIPHPMSGPTLVRILNASGSSGQIAAAAGIGKLRYAPGAQSLLGCLSTAPEDLLQKTCAQSLALLDLPETVPPLIALFHRPEWKTRMLAAEALSAMTTASVGPAALEKLRSGNTPVLSPASFVLGEKKYAYAVVDLQRVYRNTTGVDAFHSAQALGKIGDPSSIPLFLEGLEKRSGEAAHGAAWALGALKSTDAVDLMIRVLKNTRDMMLKRHVVAALGEIGDRRAVKIILDIPVSEQVEMGEIIGRSLGRLGGDDVFGALKAHLDSDDENEQRIARLILVHLKDETRIDFLLKLLESHDGQNRRAAMVALRRTTAKRFSTEKEWLEWARKR